MAQGSNACSWSWPRHDHVRTPTDTGAHQGKGLGRMFLRHLRRTRALLHVVDGSAPDPATDYYAVGTPMTVTNGGGLHRRAGSLGWVCTAYSCARPYHWRYYYYAVGVREMIVLDQMARMGWLRTPRACMQVCNLMAWTLGLHIAHGF